MTCLAGSQEASCISWGKRVGVVGLVSVSKDLLLLKTARLIIRTGITTDYHFILSKVLLATMNL